MPVVWWDGGLVDAADATIPVTTRAVQFGHGCFETLRVYEGVPFRLAPHVARLVASAAAIGLAPPADGAMEAAMRATLDANPLRDAAVRVSLFAAMALG